MTVRVIVNTICLVAVFIIAHTCADPRDLPASERGLTDINVKAAVIAEEGNHYYRGVTQKNFKGSVLGYVTPWNSHGYEVAKRWRAKFSHISPVWYQLRPEPDSAGGLKLAGGHDVDQGWIAELRAPISKDADCSDDDSARETCASDLGTSAPPPLIVPRVVVELPGQDLVAMLARPGQAIALMVDEVEQQGFDGLVFEAWLQWAAMDAFSDRDFTQHALAFIKKLAANLRDKGKVLLLAVPPVLPAQPGRPAADTSHMQQLAADLTGFSLMTYDFSAAGPGPNGPLSWQERNVRELLEEEEPEEEGKAQNTVSASQILMGLNFYGYDFTRPDSQAGSSAKPDARPIMGDAFLAVLRKNKPKLKWEEEHAEHRVKYKAGGVRHTLYYPTPASLAARIDLASEMGVGLSIWELGQGMDSFLDLL